MTPLLPVDTLSPQFGVIHKSRGQIFGYFWHPLSPSKSFILKKVHAIKWSFGNLPHIWPRGLWMSPFLETYTPKTSLMSVGLCGTPKAWNYTWKRVDGVDESILLLHTGTEVEFPMPILIHFFYCYSIVFWKFGVELHWINLHTSSLNVVEKASYYNNVSMT